MGGLVEEDTIADALCVVAGTVAGVDRVLVELCSYLTNAAVVGSRGARSLRSVCGLTREFPSSLRNIVHLFFWS